jgi:ABC-type sugar transport system ATPase subunit
VATRATAEVTREMLADLMVGRSLAGAPEKRRDRAGPVVLGVEGLRVVDQSGVERVKGVSLAVRAGEIVGLAGLVGAGRTSLALAIVGAIRSRGAVRVAGSPVRFRTPSDAIARGVAYVTEDRKAHGVFPYLGLDENITLTHLSHLATAGLLSRARLRARAGESVRAFDIRAADLAQPAGTLSGGNQQKALVARFVVEPPRVLILDEPTRGVDVGARAEIYRAMNRLTAGGLGILMISSDLPEVLGMSDRVVVMREGRTVGELARTEATAERVMALAAAAA